LGSLTLRNRIIKASTFEGMCPGGAVSDALIEHHRAVAAGGAGMTTVAYCSVSSDGRSYPTQMLMAPELVPGLRKLTAAVHKEGAAAGLQLGHCGYFANPRAIGTTPIGATRMFNTYGMSFCRAMDEADIERVTNDFGGAAQLTKDAGFDAIELHCGHGYLLSQFLSPFTNRRHDEWGGTLENRLRFPLAVVRAIREAVGPNFALFAKVNLTDGFSRGLELPEAIRIGEHLAREGVDALVTSGGFVSKTPFYMLRGDLPVRAMAEVQESWHVKIGLILFGSLLVRKYPYESGFFLREGRLLKDAVDIPVILLGGLKSIDAIEAALAEGFAAVSMGRALIHDPDFPRKLQAGEVKASACEPCNECIAEMDRGGVRCVRVDQPAGRGQTG
jgi:2,4-dienoyl-CoA reductase-like NADH-dependent reductase (Old Yellow Enzyme family)